jgi:hypothetical protein
MNCNIRLSENKGLAFVKIQHKILQCADYSQLFTHLNPNKEAEDLL